jgi:hypothetical protein
LRFNSENAIISSDGRINSTAYLKCDENFIIDESGTAKKEAKFGECRYFENKTALWIGLPSKPCKRMASDLWVSFLYCTALEFFLHCTKPVFIQHRHQLRNTSRQHNNTLTTWLFSQLISVKNCPITTFLSVLCTDP